MSEELNKAQELFNKYKLKEAKDLLCSILKKDNKNIDANILFGKLNMRTQQYGDAINCFNNVLTIDPQNSDAKTNLFLISGILQLTNNFYFENSYTNEDLYELRDYNDKSAVK